MNLDNFLKSQTFKTGVFVLFVLFIFMLVFKLGVLHGYKKAFFHQGYGINKHLNAGNNFYRHHKGVFDKNKFGDYSAKIEIIKAKKLSGLKEGSSESDEEIIVE